MFFFSRAQGVKLQWFIHDRAVHCDSRTYSFRQFSLIFFLR